MSVCSRCMKCLHSMTSTVGFHLHFKVSTLGQEGGFTVHVSSNYICKMALVSSPDIYKLDANSELTFAPEEPGQPPLARGWLTSIVDTQVVVTNVSRSHNDSATGTTPERTTCRRSSRADTPGLTASVPQRLLAVLNPGLAALHPACSAAPFSARQRSFYTQAF